LILVGAQKRILYIVGSAKQVLLNRLNDSLIELEFNR